MKYIIVVTREDLDHKFDCILGNKIYDNVYAAQAAVVNSEKEDESDKWGLYEYRIIPVST